MRRFLIALSLLFAAGCAHHPNRDGVLSQELPLTLDDLSEIRAGSQNHERILWEFRLYDNPKLQAYCNTIAANLAAVSTRPHLPYRVFLLEDNDVNVFAGPGGYIYLTRGLLNFVESESELAAVIAHEITHVAGFDYSNIPHLTKMQKVYDVVGKGVELAKDSGIAGPYGSAASIGVRNLGKVGPALGRRFGKDQEIKTDEIALQALLKAGYDPRGYLRFVDKLSKVEMDDLARFVLLLNAHPPFADRKAMLQARIQGMNLQHGKIEFKPDTFSEAREVAAGPRESILFRPNLLSTAQVSLDLAAAQSVKS